MKKGFPRTEMAEGPAADTCTHLPPFQLPAAEQESLATPMGHWIVPLGLSKQLPKLPQLKHTNLH